jgi:hypothetical protein
MPLIEIAEKHPAPAGRKMANVVTARGERLSVWPEMLAGIQIGRRYEAEIESWVSGGRTLQKITKVTPVVNGDGTVAAAAANRTSAPAQYSNGHSKDEQIWTQGLLQAALKSGQIPFEKQALWEATNLLRKLYRASFGSCAPPG